LLSWTSRLGLPTERYDLRRVIGKDRRKVYDPLTVHFGQLGNDLLLDQDRNQGVSLGGAEQSHIGITAPGEPLDPNA